MRLANFSGWMPIAYDIVTVNPRFDTLTNAMVKFHVPGKKPSLIECKYTIFPKNEILYGNT